MKWCKKNKEFEILDLDPPNNATSHYGACHFRYNLALSNWPYTKAGNWWHFRKMPFPIG